MPFRRSPLMLKAGLVAAIGLTAVIVIAAFVLRPSHPDTSPKSGAAFLALAGHIAVRDAEGGVWFYDFARARQLAGIEAPARDAPQSEVRKYAESLSLKTVTFSTPLSRFQSSTDWRTEVGFNYADIDQALWAGGGIYRPSEGVLVMAAGRFYADHIDAAIRTNSSIAKDVKTAEHAGVSYLTWEKPVPITAVWNSPWRLLLGDGVIVWTEDTALIERSIDAAADPRLSLLRLPELELIARAFDDLGVYTASYAFGLDDDWFSSYRDVIYGEYGEDLVESQTELEPYDSIVVGVGQKGHSAYAVLILVHSDAQAALANVDKLKEKVKSGISFHTRRPWREQIEKADIKAEGRLVYAKFYSANLRLTFDAWQNLDSLILQ